jgi:hypothetical protein
MTSCFKKYIFGLGMFAGLCVPQFVMAGKDDVVEMQVLADQANGEVAYEQWHDATDGTFVIDMPGEPGGEASAIDMPLIAADEQALVVENVGQPARHRFPMNLQRVRDFVRSHPIISGTVGLTSLLTLVIVTINGLHGMYTPEGQACMHALDVWCNVMNSQLSVGILESERDALCVKGMETIRQMCPDMVALKQSVFYWNSQCKNPVLECSYFS